MAFVPPASFGTIHWAQREGDDQTDPNAVLLEIRPGELDTTRSATQRIWKQFEDAASWQKLFGEVIGPLWNELEFGLGSIDLARYLSTSEGLVLDEIGALVGRDREGLEDDELYRLAIRADAATIFASGTVPEVIEISSSLLGPDIRVRQYYPGMFTVEVADPPAGVVPVLADVMADVPAAGVAGFIISWISADTGFPSSTLGTAGVNLPARFFTTSGTAPDERSLFSHAALMA